MWVSYRPTKSHVPSNNCPDKRKKKKKKRTNPPAFHTGYAGWVEMVTIGMQVEIMLPLLKTEGSIGRDLLFLPNLTLLPTL